MQKQSLKSFGLRAACALATLALTTLLANSVAFAQSEGGENPLGRPTATPPPTATPAATPAPAAAPAATPAAPATTAPATGGPKQNGLVFQLKFGGNFMNIDVGGVMGGSPMIGGWLNGGFMFGYKMGRLTLGLGIELAYGDHRYKTFSGTGMIDAVDSTALVLFSPTIEFYLLMANPLALYLTAGIHAGFLNQHNDPGDDYTDGAMGFHAGFGMRFFLHPRFALGVEGGFRGVWIFAKHDNATDDDDDTWGSMSFYGALVLTAIW
jgi:hypothetical protein